HFATGYSPVGQGLPAPRAPEAIDLLCDGLETLLQRLQAKPESKRCLFAEEPLQPTDHALLRASLSLGQLTPEQQGPLRAARLHQACLMISRALALLPPRAANGASWCAGFSSIAHAALLPSNRSARLTRPVSCLLTRRCRSLSGANCLGVLDDVGGSGAGSSAAPRWRRLWSAPTRSGRLRSVSLAPLSWRAGGSYDGADGCRGAPAMPGRRRGVAANSHRAGGPTGRRGNDAAGAAEQPGLVAAGRRRGSQSKSGGRKRRKRQPPLRRRQLLQLRLQVEAVPEVASEVALLRQGEALPPRQLLVEAALLQEVAATRGGAAARGGATSTRVALPQREVEAPQLPKAPQPQKQRLPLNRRRRRLRSNRQPNRRQNLRQYRRHNRRQSRQNQRQLIVERRCPVNSGAHPPRRGEAGRGAGHVRGGAENVARLSRRLHRGRRYAPGRSQPAARRGHLLPIPVSDAGNPSFDDAYIFGEIVRLLVKHEKFDDARLPDMINRVMITVDKMIRLESCKQSTRGVNGRSVDDLEMQAFFQGQMLGLMRGLEIAGTDEDWGMMNFWNNRTWTDETLDKKLS
uniref:CNOT1_TTP_bind domain-containing protein n=1 Tax=Macrostomum lignano TaxID=282301 RepID=A0A1I8FIU5_9PLAT